MASNDQIHSLIIAGVESTGKSTLALALGNKFKTLTVPEFAREYLEINGANYDYDDFLQIARGQLNLEQDAFDKFQPPGFIIFDTDLIVIRIWAEIVFGKVEPWIEDAIWRYANRFYILPNTEAPWIMDEMREYPDPLFRKELHEKYKATLMEYGFPWVELTGSDFDDRFIQAVSHIKSWRAKHRD